MKNKKIMLISMFIAMTAIIMIPGKVHAAYQSKPGSILTSATADTYFEGCRNMETNGGVLGLKEVLADDYTGTTKNGIDSHMILNTEWGTIALLTDSTYGIGKEMPGWGNDNTTTGNATGIYGMNNRNPEYTATTVSDATSQYNIKMRSANSIYFNDYTDKKSKLGDAISCWSSNSLVTASEPVYGRAKPSSFWNCSGHSGSGSTTYYIGGTNEYYSSRAVVVCGAGL